MKPERVFHYFREISDIPRGSYNEKAVSDYILKTAKDMGLYATQDELLNVYIRKEASKGCEDKPGIIMQGHMDMVCEKATSSNHDFMKDKIEWKIEGDTIYANDTTLGADNGIAIAMALAILEDNSIIHPQIEVIITTSEETEMEGALGLSDSLLKGKYLLNIDSEEEGILTLGSAGGVLFTATLTPKYESEEVDTTTLHFDGYFGGHSGMDINKNRKNMIKTFVDFISKTKLSVSSLEVGTKDNAIPRSGQLVVGGNKDEVSKIVESYLSSQEKSDEILTIEITSESKSRLFTKNFQYTLFTLLKNLPSGVDKEDETGVISSSNLAVVKLENGVINVLDSIRSSDNHILEELKTHFSNIASDLNVESNFSGAYPGWEKKDNSRLQEIANNVYFKMYNKHFENIVIHAGLECGAIYEKYPHLEIISFGPDIRNAHTPKEHLYISSTERVYDYLKNLVEELAKV